MNGAAWLLAMATLGVDYGWQLDQQGQLEYIIQIPASQLETLRDSPDGISSSIPPEVVRHVKRFRIVVGNKALPRDPLPALPAEGAVTPINVGASRVNPVGGEFPAAGGELSAGYDTPALESTVTPLDSLNAPRNVLPGPSRDATADSRDLVEDILPVPRLPRADRIPEVDSVATTLPRTRIHREANDGSFRPNTSAPDMSDGWDEGVNRPASYAELTTTSPVARSLGGNELRPAWNNSTLEKQPPYVPLLMTVCALCLSIGGNIYLGWIAWGYYLKYRESFESWRSGWTQS